MTGPTTRLASVVAGVAVLFALASPLVTAEPTEPALLWEYQTPLPERGSATASVGDPQVMDGRVFLIVLEGQDPEDFEHRLYAFDAKDGSVIWSTVISPYLEDFLEDHVLGLAASDGVLYTYRQDGEVYAIDAEDGSRLWTARLDTSNDPYFHLAPVVADDTLYLGGKWASREIGEHTESFQLLYALDTQTGSTRWRSEIHDGEPVADLVAGPEGVLFGAVGFDGPEGPLTSARVYSLDGSTGATVWQTDVGTASDAHARLAGITTPTLADGTVYVGSNSVDPETGETTYYGLYALDATTGAIDWSNEGSVSATPVVVDGTVYAFGASLRALSAKDGSELWHNRATQAFRAHHTPAYAGGVLYALGNTEALLAADATDGTYLWSFPLPTGAGPASPTVEDGVVYVRNAAVALDGATVPERGFTIPGPGFLAAVLVMGLAARACAARRARMTVSASGKMKDSQGRRVE